jgi:hypothetical protein
MATQLVGAIGALWTASAVAQPASGPRETVDQEFTTTSPATPTGLKFTATYHGAGDPSGNPPFMRRMVFDPPGTMRFHTGVPPQCAASDPELQLLGPDACPAGSVLGTGTAEGLILEPVAHDFVFDHFKHDLYVVNGRRQQIVLIKSEGYTVLRGRIRDDGSQVFTPPTCFPAPPTGRCVDDYVVQLGTSTDLPEYTRMIDGKIRSYATTPSTCPDGGYWRTRIHFDWSDGARDSVVSRQPCQG